MYLYKRCIYVTKIYVYIYIFLFGVYLTIYINMVLICINTMCTCTWYPGPRPSLESRQPKLAKVFVSEFDVWDLVRCFVLSTGCFPVSLQVVVQLVAVQSTAPRKQNI